MKRCPQCYFFYEDDQSLCDMDGRELVYHSGPVASEGSSTQPLMKFQENPWAAESLSVSGVVAQQAPSEPRPVASFEPRSQGRSEWKRFTLTAAAVMLGVLVFLVYHVASRHTISKPETQNSKVEALPAPSSSPETPVANDAPAVDPSGEALAQDASEAAAANASKSPEENVDQTKTTNSSISSSDTRSLKVPSGSSDSSASSYRELSANKSKSENITTPKDTSVGKHEPVVPKGPATAKPAAPVAQNQPKVAKSEDAKAKKDSKVSSFFKKAGRVLKKPF